jgi:hypothetical protein
MCRTTRTGSRACPHHYYTDGLVHQLFLNHPEQAKDDFEQHLTEYHGDPEDSEYDEPSASTRLSLPRPTISMTVLVLKSLISGLMILISSRVDSLLSPSRLPGR